MKKYLLVLSLIERGIWDLEDIMLVEDVAPGDAILNNTDVHFIDEAINIAGDDGDGLCSVDVADAAMYGDEWATHAYTVPEGATEMVIPCNAYAVEDLNPELMTVEGFKAVPHVNIGDGLRMRQEGSIYYVLVNIAAL